MNGTVLGISAWYHDSAAVLLKNGEIMAASQEERFTRKKFDASFPHNAIAFCLHQCNLTIDEIDEIVFYENSYLKFERILLNAHITVPKSLSYFVKIMPDWLNKKIWTEKIIQKELGIKKKISFFDHHGCHAASAFFPSPFTEAAILTVDGVGEWATVSCAIGKKNSISFIEEMKYPNSLGLLYSAFTYYCGFRINSGEYKLMGLAPYGQPVYADLIKEKIVHIFDDGSIILNQKYFDFAFSFKTINSDFELLFGRTARTPDSPIDSFFVNIAASIQSVTEEIMLKLAEHLHKLTKCDNLVLAGGVALNVKANAHILRESSFKNIWVQPAAGDAGGALGAALLASNLNKNINRQYKKADGMKYALLGYEIKEKDTQDEICLNSIGAIFHHYDENTLAKKIAQLLADGNIIGIARGKAEFGPRALGNRSILADARDADMQRKLNMQIKFRESFRPFAPVVLEEDAELYFNSVFPSHYMTFCFDVKEDIRKNFIKNDADIFDTAKADKSSISAVTHVDYSSRVQTVSPESNPFLYSVLLEYKKLTGCSVLVNTSYNVRGEPIVNNCIDAYSCFMKTEMDYAVIGNRLFEKKEQQYENI